MDINLLSNSWLHIDSNDGKLDKGYTKKLAVDDIKLVNAVLRLEKQSDNIVSFPKRNIGLKCL